MTHRIDAQDPDDFETKHDYTKDKPSKEKPQETPERPRTEPEKPEKKDQ